MKRQPPPHPELGFEAEAADRSTSAAGAPQFIDTINHVATVPRRGDEEWHTASAAPPSADPLDHRLSRQERTQAQHHGRGRTR